jgi:uncharacterized protein YdhG (YjbR/CyaY superfamily)
MATPKFRDYNAKDVDAYIKGYPKDAQLKLTELRRLIKATIPNVEEQISWGVPFYRKNGLLGGLAAFKTYVSFGVAFTLSSALREELEKKGYETGSRTIKIYFEKKVPVRILRRILKAKAKENKANKK